MLTEGTGAIHHLAISTSLAVLQSKKKLATYIAIIIPLLSAPAHQLRVLMRPCCTACPASQVSREAHSSWFPKPYVSTSRRTVVQMQ